MAFDIPTDSQVDTPSNIQILTNKIYYKAQKSVSVHYIAENGQPRKILLNHLKQVRYTSIQYDYIIWDSVIYSKP